MTSETATAVMIAGVGGASLGTELAKCLNLAGRYRVFGCDISKTAYGLYSADFEETFLIDPDDYIVNVISACQRAKCRWLLPGGEQPNILLAAADATLRDAGIHLVSNSSAVISLFSDKQATFDHLRQSGFSIPKTAPAVDVESIGSVGLPCIVKPTRGTGGSVFVFLAASVDEAMLYSHFIRNNGLDPIAQEYIGAEEGEFTVGVLNLPNGVLAGSIALRRSLDAKLSVAYRGPNGIISSGYSQGYIGDFPEVRRAAEAIAASVNSCGPLNVQGRLRENTFIPFEINPRFSASTYLRALAGFNEIDITLQFLSKGLMPSTPTIDPGWYLRSLTETFAKELRR